jgi:hypothetical protein
MNAPIEDQLRDYFTMVDRMQGPVDTTPQTAPLSLVNDTNHDTKNSTMEVNMLSPDRNEPRNRSRIWMAVAASVAALALVGGLIVIANRDTDDNVPADQPPVAVTVPGTTGVDGGTAPAALAAIGERLMTAFDNGDPGTVAELVTDDASPIAMIGVTTKSGLIDLFGYIEAAGLGFDVQECVVSEPDQVRCTVLQSSGFADAARVAPGDATMLLKIADGRVVALRYGRAEGHGLAHDRFSSFIRETDPSATEKMWWSTSTGEPYPLLTEESFELFERYLQDFIDSES